MPKHSKRYSNAAEQIEADNIYQPQEAIDIIKGSSSAKFDETMELHLRTGADTRHAEQMVRGVAILPHGLGKQVRVAVFASGEAADIARQAGADFVGDDDLIEQVDGGWADFEVGLAVPDIMPKGTPKMGTSRSAPNQKHVKNSDEFNQISHMDARAQDYDEDYYYYDEIYGGKVHSTIIGYYLL